MENLALAAESWTPVPKDAVILSFLRSEWGKIRANASRALIDNTDIDDRFQNNARTKLLWDIRGGLIRDIPGDTAWFAVRFLRQRHLDELHAIRFGEWNGPDDLNELRQVALRRPESLRVGSNIESWEPILWSHSRDGPFTVLEGNHRLTALRGSSQIHDFQMVTYVGTCASMCRWHRPDHPS
jgi:hypothetical protein